MNYITVNDVMLAVFLTIALLFTYKTLVEKDLLKAVIYSAVESASYTVVFTSLFAPDLALAYVAIGVGVYSALFLLVISRTERFEGGDSNA